MKIPFCDLNSQRLRIKEKIDNRIKTVLEHGQYIMGPEILELENKLSEFCDDTYCITTSNGTDALLLPLLAWDIQSGDEVITSPFTFVSTLEVISLIKAKTVLVDISEDDFLMNQNLAENAITNKTKVILPISLFGLLPDLPYYEDLAHKKGIYLLEDACQSFGATFNNKKSCTFGHAAATSFFPAKPLGCYGDGGAVFTNDKILADKIKQLRSHGQSQKYEYATIGINGRLDTIQAAILLEKIEIFEEEIRLRNSIANHYNQFLENISAIKTPKIFQNKTSVWAQYSIVCEDRDELKKHLDREGIPTAIYYPKPLHLQDAYKSLGYKEGDFPVSERIAKSIISLPMSPYVDINHQKLICEKIKEFYR